MKVIELTQHALTVSRRISRCLAPLSARISAKGTMRGAISQTTLVSFSPLILLHVFLNRLSSEKGYVQVAIASL